MVKCCVEGCRSNSKFSSSEVTFHRLPDARCFPNLFGKWLRRISGRSTEPIPPATSRVCSLHFVDEDFVVRTDRNRTRKTLRVEAVPTLRLPEDVDKVETDVLEQLYQTTTRTLTTTTAAATTTTTGVGDYGVVVGSRHSPDDGNAGLFEEAHIKSNRFKRMKYSRGVALEDLSFRLGHNGEELDIPPCYRVKRQVYSPYAFSIAPLEPEHGFSVIAINDNKFIRCESTLDEYHVWRCINKNCVARAATSAVHCSILISLQGLHYHLPTLGERLNPVDWSPQSGWGEMDAEEDGSGSWSQNAGEGQSSCDQSPVEVTKVPPWARHPSSETNGTAQNTDNRFAVKDLLTPAPGHFLLLNSQQQPVMPFPVLTSLDALSKLCGGQVVQVPQNNGYTDQQQPPSREMGTLREDDGHQFSPMPQMDSQSDHPGIIVTPQSLEHEDQVEYILPNDVSEISNVRSNETSDGSSSERLSSRMEDQTPFYEFVNVVDADAIIKKDPLGSDEQDCSRAEMDLSLSTKEEHNLNDEDATFFQTLGPHLRLLTPSDKDIFRKKVMDTLSQLCKKVTIRRYEGNPNC